MSTSEISSNSATRSLHKIRFYKQTASSKAKYHLTVGHETHMATVTFFSLPSPAARTATTGADVPAAAAAATTTPTEEKKKESEALDMQRLKLDDKPYDLDGDRVEFDHTKEYVFETEAYLTNEEHPPHTQFALVRLEKPLVAPMHAIAIASHLDTDLTANQCRLVFYGRILRVVDTSPAALKSLLKVYKPKMREGQIERVVDAHSAIGKGLVKKEDDVNRFVNMKVEVGSRRLSAVVESSFGKTGKYKLRFINGDCTEDLKGAPVYLRFKRYVYDSTKHLVQ